MVIIAIANQKGGVGKTSTAINLSAALARAGKRVLLADLDPQSSLTQYFTPPTALHTTMYDMLLKNMKIETIKVSPNIELLPSNIDLAAAEIELPAKLNQVKTLDRMLKHYQADFCLIDCPPSLGVLTTNALTAANYVLIPVATELMAERTIPLILSTIEEVRESELNPQLTIWRILPTMYDQRYAHHKEIFRALMAKYKARVYGEPVKARSKYKDAVTSQTDVASMDSKLGSYWDEMAHKLISEIDKEGQR